MGWIRTGTSATNVNIKGSANCADAPGPTGHPWTSSSDQHFGSVVELQSFWASEIGITAITPWTGTSATCSLLVRVWCISD